MEPLSFETYSNYTVWNKADQCQEVGKLNASLRCNFTRTTPDCSDSDGYIHYLDGAFCRFPPSLFPLAIFLYVLWLLYLFIILAVTAEKFFCPNLSAISRILRLSHNVAGVTFLAFGNGAPDVFSALAAFSDSRTAGLAIGALFGAGVFVTTVVAGGISIVKPFTAASRPFLRDIVFYISAIFLTFFVLYQGYVTLAEALVYLLLYLVYVFVVVLSTWIYRRMRQQQLSVPVTEEPDLLGESEDDCITTPHGSEYGDEYQPLFPMQRSTWQILTSELNPVDARKWKQKSWKWRTFKMIKVPVEFLLLLTVPVVDPDKEERNWQRPLNCLHLITTPLLCVFTMNAGTYGLYIIKGVMPVWAVLLIIGTFSAAVVFLTTTNGEPPKYHCLFSFLGFVASALWISATATEVVNLLRTFGVIFRLSNTVLGLTLLAWGNSIGDFVSDITLARQGYPRMAFSACFGGIIFNVLIGVGLGCLMQMGPSKTSFQLEHQGLLVWILAGGLGISLVFSLISVPAQSFHLRRGYGVALLFIYVLFLTVALLTEFGVIRLEMF
ncbi:solute carrier family 8 (sodium/lithium/calcium exchanger), member B1 S homeolog isoform X1 [Xenopus laevis]|uniref:Solute carrier family 8 (Sodium/lithium/calcium exchanger), member B1 S homeolog isoform X1 n=1 Tax=Xenopus laevis TaxID=8355 RepID=A0A8J1LFK3_XENLA|nr:solute carrier family 8 (sodium/lithium/calcium exchanger), member B1 S homeolog isoform X1 [Xenopus laevis]XP_041428323.1 solute carrier family 8 (sodium/lithium/calcium exchanger), member B1 S homeolog isoform X1 [Xenopus laevis]XP_041428328.1 solute carrier family 8 (sodium/lithium/calcium exchanger), member B1 S homeolog isoform X1 [Xenopus laevis]XP_041428330.1 solute carrier family 8 (sodium/lithium/calcium exchanger), member B1 S homeolog isoform X1 [Xenopus laevis]